MNVSKTDRSHGVVCENVLEELRRDIVLKRYPPGSRLVEDRLARDFHASRGSVRVAIQALIKEGVLSETENGGKIVLEITGRTIENMYELRQWLELKALETLLAADSIQYTQLIGVLSQIEEKNVIRSVEDYYKLDILFHKSILVMSGNRAILQAWANMASVIHTLMTVNASSEYKERYIGEFASKHKDILGKIILRDRMCLDLMAQHIDDAKKITLGVLQEIEKGAYQ